MKIHSKNLFLSTGFWGILGQAAFAIAPNLAEIDKTGHVTFSAIAAMCSAAAFAIAAAIDKLDDNNAVLYTPNGIPGLNRGEAKTLARTQSEALNTQSRFFPKATDGDNEFWNPEQD